MPDIEKIRVQKLIADSGYCSRRKAEEYIEAGAVKVNGRAVKLGDKAAKRDVITVNGEKISFAPRARYIKMYKPRGYLCSMSDPHAKKLITELLSDVPERVYPVGRLDANSEGLIFLTNDGGFANMIAHPGGDIKKVYRVTVPQSVTDAQVALLASGVDIGEGAKTRPCAVEVLSSESGRTVLRITLTEGRNRQIRRMCEAASLPVSRLKRVSVGGVKLGMLKPGEYADLSKEELRLLKVILPR